MEPRKDHAILKNYGPFSKRVIYFENILQPNNNDIVDNFQSAYKAVHSCEIA